MMSITTLKCFRFQNIKEGEERDLYLGVIERGLLEIGALLKEYNVI